MTSHSNQVEALLEVATVLTKVVHGHLITKSNGCFSVLTLLDLSGAHDTIDHSCIPETLSFLGFCDTTCFCFFFLHVCLFLYKFLFVFYNLKHVGVWSLSSILFFTPKLSWGNLNHFLGISSYLPKYKTTPLPNYPLKRGSHLTF